MLWVLALGNTPIWLQAVKMVTKAEEAGSGPGQVTFWSRYEELTAVSLHQAQKEETLTLELGLWHRLICHDNLLQQTDKNFLMKVVRSVRLLSQKSSFHHMYHSPLI